MLQPQTFTQSENLRVVGKVKAFQKKLGQSEFKIGTNYTIQLDNWKLFSEQKLLPRQFTRLCYIKV